MRFRISTLLMLITIFCLGIGWFVDRSTCNRRVASLLDGAAAHDSAVTSGQLLYLLKNDPTVVPDWAERRVVRSILVLHRYSDDVDSFLKYLNLTNTARNTALDTAYGALETLGCDSADAYFEKFRLNYDSDLYDEYKDTATAEHIEFRSFIENAIGAQGSSIR